MASASPRPKKRREGVFSRLDAVIQIVNLAKGTCGIPPAQVVFGSVSVLLTMIRDSMTSDQDYVDLGVACADVCKALNRGLDGRQLDDLSKSLLGAIEQLMTTIAKIQRRVINRGKRHIVSRVFHSKADKDAIAAWRQDLNRILHIFNTELLINNHTVLLAIRRNTFAGQEGSVGQYQSAQASVPLGEMPPPPPRACFGRDEVIKAVIGLAENLEPVALIGAGGIGKTSIALKVLHHNRIKDRFGENRRFIRCDQFPASRVHLLNRLSKVIGAGVENLEDLTPLRRFLSSTEMILFLDNAESILDPAGPDAREIYGTVEELTRFENICLCITTRISTVPPHCKRPIIPTLSMESACDIFYGICNSGERSDIISGLVKRLDFHALSITLLATAASHNMWDYDRLAKEWEIQRAQVLQTDYNESLATTIELSLASQTFRKLTPSPLIHRTPHERVNSSMPHNPAPSARELLEVVAFFPQGVDENNLDWLFPTISDRKNIFNKFCVLSLTYRINGFVTMLAPVRDYLTPKDPRSHPLLCATKERYFSRLSVNVDPSKPGFEETGWIMSEDVNIEHLLDVFISIGPDVGGIWDACYHFMKHLYWHKPRQTVLRTKVEGLPDDHPSKPNCLSILSGLFESVGNHVEQKRILIYILGLGGRRGDRSQVAPTLGRLSDVNRRLGHSEEGIQQAREALEIYEQLGDTIGQAFCLNVLAWSLFSNEQLDVAENTASRAIDLATEKGQELVLSQLHRVLGKTYHSKGEKEKAIRYFETALGIASPLNLCSELFAIHHDLAEFFYDEYEFDNANTHIKQAKSHVVKCAYFTGRATMLQAQVLCRQGRLKGARSDALRALEAYEKLGAGQDEGDCRDFLRRVERAMDSQSNYVGSDCSGEPLEMKLRPARVDSPSLAGSRS